MAHLVVKNEADRYLWDCLNSLSGYVDHIHVYDDQSTDDTVEMARRLGAEVYTRPDDVPTFLEDEALFRQAAWESMGRLPGATILCMDADEFLTGDIDGLYFEQDNIVKGFHVREIFGTDGDVPLIRTDGFWGQITAARWAPWTDRSEFPKRRMGCGSLPESLANGPVTILEDVELLHYGYLREEDRAAKHQRYSGRPGHNPKHINSIITTPTLRPRAQLAHH